MIVLYQSCLGKTGEPHGVITTVGLQVVRLHVTAGGLMVFGGLGGDACWALGRP